MSLEHRNLVDPDLGDPLQGPMRQALLHDPLDGPEHASPVCFKDLGHLSSGQPPGPASQEDLVTRGHLLLPIRPRHPLDLHPVDGTIHSPGRIAKDDPIDPQRNVLKISRLPGIIRGPLPPTHRTFWPAVLSGKDLHNHRRFPEGFLHPDVAKHKGLELLHAIE